MNTDKSKIMYDKLDEVVHKKVKLHLKKGEIKTGVIVGFFHGAAEYVERWVFQETDDETNEAIILNAEEGEIIKQKDILQVFFFDDKSQIIF